MKNKFTVTVTVAIIVCLFEASLSSCKSCNKKEETKTVSADTTSTTKQPEHTINLPHGDTTLIPILSKVMDDAFDASGKKDYSRLAALVVYRGPDSLKFGYDVFNVKNNYDRKILKITSEVFNKWNDHTQSRDYLRVFEMPQPDGRTMSVMEVLFVSPKSVERKFFGFLLINNEWKIADVTSYL